jgi:putative RecB family exonuclease
LSGTSSISTGSIVDLREIAPRRRSVSQMSSYMQCGESYRLERVARAPRRPAAWFMMGTAVHYVIEMWELWGRQGTVKQAREMYAGEFDRLVAEELERTEIPTSSWLTGSKKSGDVDVAERREKGQDHVQNYIEWAEATSPDWRIATLNDRPMLEYEFELDFGGVAVKGFIDQVVEDPEGKIYARDLKSGSRIPETPFQLAVYAQVLRSLGIDSDEGSFVMTKNSDPKKIEHREPLGHWTKDKIDRMFQQFDAVERLGIYIPEPGGHCRTCGVAKYCSLMGHPDDAALYPPGVTPLGLTPITS